MESVAHIHWSFTAYDDGVQNPVEISVVGYPTEADARVAADDMCHRQHLILRRVFECSTCAFQRRTLTAIEKAVNA